MTVMEQPCKITIASNLTLHLETGRSCFRNSVPGNKQALANTNKLRRKNFSKNPDLSDEYTRSSVRLKCRSYRSKFKNSFHKMVITQIKNYIACYTARHLTVCPHYSCAYGCNWNYNYYVNKTGINNLLVAFFISEHPPSYRLSFNTYMFYQNINRKSQWQSILHTVTFYLNVTRLKQCCKTFLVKFYQITWLR